MMSSFYVVLPSNASFNLFKDNKLHTYKVQIPKLPSTEGEWVVGLTEICFPNRWPNLREDCFVHIKWNNSDETISYPIPAGYYTDINTLLNKIRSILSLNKSGTENSLKFTFDEVRNRVGVIVYPNAEFSVRFSSSLAAPLGYDGDKVFSKGYNNAPYPADINDGNSALYIYSDIVQKRLVGDYMVPLLKVVPAEPIYNGTSHRWVKIQNVEYVPSVKTHVDTIEVNIRRDNGEIIPFDHGKVVVTLHFKQVS